MIRSRHRPSSARFRSREIHPPTDSLEPYLTSANEASKLVRQVYLSFLLVGVYFAILIGSTTDEQLLRGTAQILPVLQVKLSIVGVYAVAPLVFLFLHLNLLIQLHLLSQKLRVFEEKTKELPKSERRREWSLLYSFPFNHMLIGSRQGWFLHIVFSVMVISTIICFPAFLLVWFQVRFLPYHNPVITWVHRAAACSDLFLIWVMWPKIVAHSQKWYAWWLAGRGIKFFNARFVSVIILSVPLIIICLFLAFIPEKESEKRKGLFRNYLVLPEMTLVREEPSPEILAAYELQNTETDTAWIKYAKGLDLKGRDLRFGNLMKSVLFKADLKEASLQGVNCWHAKMQDANLWKAKLTGSKLIGAHLQNANLSEAELQGADLKEARLQGTNLFKASLQGASLEKAHLQGAKLWRARLQGANLEQAKLQGANLWQAKLQGVSLLETELQAVLLNGKKLQGAIFEKAQLSGANLYSADIGGSDFKQADMSLCNLSYLKCVILQPNDWKKLRDEFEGLKQDRQVPDALLDKAIGKIYAAEQRTQTVLPDLAKLTDILYEKTENCPDWSVQSMDEDAYYAKLIPFLLDLACSDQYVAFGILRRPYGPRTADFTKVLLESDCDVLRELPRKMIDELPSEMRETLKKIQDKSKKKAMDNNTEITR